jgi:transcriptional regulator with XRE-family HTH domain
MNGLVKNLKQEFADEEYRHSYAESFLNSSIATQIKVLREQRKWRQADLAREAEMKQSVVSRLENVDYSSWSIKSLKKLAQAFDVVLTVRFERFKNLALDAERFGRKNLEVPRFKDDPFFAGVQELRPLQTPLSTPLSVKKIIE